MEKFEVFIDTEEIMATDWQRLIQKIFEYDKKFALEIVFAGNEIRF